jgi:hypothetical protein
MPTGGGGDSALSRSDFQGVFGLRTESGMSDRNQRLVWSAVLVIGLIAEGYLIYLLWVVEFSTSGGSATGVLGWVTETDAGGRRTVGVDPVGLLGSVALTILSIVLVGGVVLLSIKRLVWPYRDNQAGPRG